MSLAMACGIISSFLLMVSYGTYFFLVVRRQVTPNLYTWMIVLPVALLNSWTYLGMLQEGAATSQADSLIKTMPALTMSVLTVFQFLYMWLARRFVTRFGIWEKTSTALLLMATIVWLTSNPTVANLTIQVVINVSFWPTLAGLYHGQLREKWPPWLTATVAYDIGVIPLFIQWQGFAPLAFPIINGMLGNGAIGCLAIYSTRTKR